MNEKTDLLTEFLSLTTAIYTQASSVDSDMEKNNVEQLETLQDLFVQRQQTIEILASQAPGEWSAEQQHVIGQIQVIEVELQPLMGKLHEQFSIQMNRISQTKQASGKYAGAYRQTASGGSFIDQRK
ncbi:flagellar protein FliT [Planococcus dechangensis]|uniref:Flagellar protein FliT n=1 Tax=Planococcus dechangensis TaxID=1176255 RepID=A0ABV9MA11_9BACL